MLSEPTKKLWSALQPNKMSFARSSSSLKEPKLD